MASTACCSTSVLVATFLERTSSIDRSGLVGGIGPLLGMLVMLLLSIDSKADKELFSEVASLGLIDFSD